MYTIGAYPNVVLSEKFIRKIKAETYSKEGIESIYNSSDLKAYETQGRE